jgi:hypothetical protein
MDVGASVMYSYKICIRTLGIEVSLYSHIYNLILIWIFTYITPYVWFVDIHYHLIICVQNKFKITFTMPIVLMLILNFR